MAVLISFLSGSFHLARPVRPEDHEQRTPEHSKDPGPLGHGDWRGLDFPSVTLFLFLHCLRTNTTVTYVLQLMPLMTYSLVRNISDFQQF